MSIKELEPKKRRGRPVTRRWGDEPLRDPDELDEGGLTYRERAILQVLVKVGERGWYPARRELKVVLGVSSHQMLTDNLVSLERKRYIKRNEARKKEVMWASETPMKEDPTPDVIDA